MLIRNSLFLLLIINLFACKSSQKLTSNYYQGKISEITLEKLIGENLSEDMNRVSSKNDEIVLLYFLMDPNGNISTSWASDYILFESRGEAVDLNQTINTTDATILKIFLIEQDTERTEKEIEELIINNIGKNKTEINKILKDDDLLYLKSFDLNQAQFYKENKLKMWGVHIGDEFEYWLEFEVE